MNETLLELSQIKKSFFNPVQVDVLCGIDLKIIPSQSLAIVGASGEGKSTLLHIAGGLEKPTSGSVLLKNKPLSTPKQRNENYGFVFQSFHLLEDMNTLQNVLMPASIARSENEYRKKALDLIEQVGLTNRRDFPVKYLSGGEKQRLCIARALCLDPPLIIADEPSGNLDSSTSKMIHDLLIGITKKNNRALLVATHSNELANLCDEKYILISGKLHCYKEPVLLS